MGFFARVELLDQSGKYLDEIQFSSKVGRVTIGRGKKNNITNGSLLPKHADIIRTQGVYTIADLTEGKGTVLVNQKPIILKVLDSGDLIQFTNNGSGIIKNCKLRFILN